MTNTSIRLVYAQHRRFAQNLALDILKADRVHIKRDLFERVRKAVEAASRESWLDVWDYDPRDDSGVDTEGIAYFNVNIAISKFKNAPKISVVQNAVQRALKKIEGKYTGTVNPAETALDDEDEDFITVYVTAKITRA